MNILKITRYVGMSCLVFLFCNLSQRDRVEASPRNLSAPVFVTSSIASDCRSGCDYWYKNECTPWAYAEAEKKRTACRNRGGSATVCTQEYLNALATFKAACDNHRNVCYALSCNY
jgi:hypothetical protein